MEILSINVLNEEELNVIAHADAVCTHFSRMLHQVLDAKKKYHFKLAVDFDVYRDFDGYVACLYIDYFMIRRQICLLYHSNRFFQEYDDRLICSHRTCGSILSVWKWLSVFASVAEYVIDVRIGVRYYHAGFVCEHLIHGEIVEA